MFNILNWYWVGAGTTSQVWSSLDVQYVSTTDSTYEAWLAAGFRPTNINGPGELWQVLVSQWMPLTIKGVSITSTGTSALNGVYAIDPTSLAQITSLSTGIAAGKPLPGGGGTFNYPDASGTMHAFSSANFLNFATAIEGLIYNAEQALSTLVFGGSASMPSASLTIA